MNIKKAKEIYFKLRYIERITDYARLSNYEKKAEEEVRKIYSTLNQYYFTKINDEVKINQDEFDSLLSSFIKYNELSQKYNNENRKFLFENPEKIVEWFESQNNMCGYCGITQTELQEVKVKRDGNLTLNKKTKRSQGILEIEQKIPVVNTTKAYDDFNNLILACPLCNNAKSNLIDEESWREIFVDSMRKYYEKILGKELLNTKP
ncbi:MAG: HNH endonuclease [Arcobacteraceae bacterium]